jgi:hypothetical protein
MTSSEQCIDGRPAALRSGSILPACGFRMRGKRPATPLPSPLPTPAQVALDGWAGLSLGA